MKRVTFITSENHSVGFGHKSRCGAIAEAVETMGGTVETNSDNTKVISMCIDVPGKWEGPEEPDDASYKRVFMDNRDMDRSVAEAVVYPTMHWQPDQWDFKHGDRVFAGPKYIPLSRACMEAEAPKKDIDILLTFGGSDPDEMTERVQRALHIGACTAMRELKVIAVSIGPYMKERDRAIMSRAHLTCSGDELYGFMARARCAITHIGHTMNELAFHRVPTMLLARKKTDAEAMKVYQHSGPFIPLGINPLMDDDELAAALDVNVPVALKMKRTEEIPHLGEGAERLAKLLLGQ